MGRSLCSVDAPFQTTEGLARAIWEARVAGHMTQEELAAYLGVSTGTVKRWEKGEEASLGKSVAARRATAILVAEATGKREVLGLSGQPAKARVEERLDLLDEAVQRLAQRSLEQAELGDFEQWWTTDPRSEEEDPGAENE